MDRPEVSVIVPALNEEAYLPILLESLCAQESVALEVIVVEGSSTDRTVAVAQQVASRPDHSSVSISVHTVTVRNVSFQRNYGAARSHAPYLLFLDADIRLPDRRWVRRMLDTFQRRGLTITSCRFRPTEKHRLVHINFLILFVFHSIMQYFNPYAAGAVLLTTREAFDRVGGFDERLTLNEDANLVKRMTAFGKFRVLSEVCEVSARRFIQGGYIKTGLKYLRIFLNRTLHGENTSTHGYWDQSPEKKKS